jgi:D-alanyl-D-alanine carboxypeptidase/D-alanyl-D-alanine-endopeptidase (penicillin-binding protein 4)
MRLIFIFLFSIFNLSFLLSQKYNRRIEKKIDKVEAFKGAILSMSISELASNKKIVALDQEKYMTPASNIKLLTFLGAIQSFDSLPILKYFKDKDTITHFKSVGYPLLLHPLYEDKDLLRFFKNQTQLVYHTSISDISKYGSGWSWDDYNYYFSSEISAFPIYGNVLNIHKDSIRSNPIVTPKYFKNKLQQRFNKTPSKIYREENQNNFRYNLNNWKLKDTIQVPFITSDSLFVKLLSQAINIKTMILPRSKNDSLLPWKTLYLNDSSSLYKALLQDSDNLVAESLLLMLSQEKFKTFDTRKTISLLNSQWSNFISDPLIWVDGSGVSRYNLVTSRSLIFILKQIYKEIGWDKIEELFAAGGESGTIKEYYKSEKKPYVYAKTGTLRNTHNLSGYLIGKSNKKYIFSIMVNHHKDSNQEVREAIGEILKYFRKKL